MASFLTTAFTRGHSLSVTRLDLIKTAALLIMIIDHAGHYFMDNDPFWRAVGRMGLPVWFFLAGHSQPRTLWDRYFWGAALVLQIVHAWAYQDLYPFNALITVWVIHVQTCGLAALEGWWQQHTPVLRHVALAGYIGLLLALDPLTTHLWEYGSLALLFGLCGFFKRHDTWLSKAARTILFLCVTLIACVIEITWFNFTLWPALLCACGITGAMAVLSAYRPHVYPHWRSVLLRLGGRYTLEFYVVHVSLFMIIARLLIYLQINNKVI